MSINSKKLDLRNEVLTIRINPDATLLGIHGENKYSQNSALNLYDGEGNYLASIPRRHDDYQDDVMSTDVFDISPNGSYIAVCHHESTSFEGQTAARCLIWDNKEKTYLPPFISQKIKNKSYAARAIRQRVTGFDYLRICFLPDSERLIIVTDSGEILVWNISQQRFLWSVSAAAHRATSVAFSNQFGLFAMAEELLHYPFARIGLLNTVSSSVHYITGRSQIEPNPKTTSERFEEGYFLRLWNIYSGELIQEFNASQPVSDLVFSHDDKYIAGQMKGTAFIWDVNTGGILDALPENTKPIGFTKNARHLIVIHESDTIALWDMEAKSWQQRFKLEGLITSAQLSQNDKIVALSKAADAWYLHQIQL